MTKPGRIGDPPGSVSRRHGQHRGGGLYASTLEVPEDIGPSGMRFEPLASRHHLRLLALLVLDQVFADLWSLPIRHDG